MPEKEPEKKIEKKPEAKKNISGQAEALATLTGTVPQWCNATVIAQLLGKGVRRINQLTADGILETETPPGGGRRKYRTCETVQRYIAHIEKRAQEKGGDGQALNLKLKKLEAEIALKESQGQLHHLKTAIVEGEYIPAEQAAEELAEFMAGFKQFAMNIPPRIVGTLVGSADALTARALEKALRREIEAMLTAFVEAAIPENEETG